MTISARVLDLTRVLAGPLATMILGDLGADVIKVERLGAGDETRAWGPPFDDRGEAAYYLSVNRNKRSVTADLTVAADRELVLRLMADADVVVENFLPGALARLGLDAESLLERYPQLIWCTISGFGPESMRPGYDFVVQAEQGWMAITGEPEGAPMKHGVALADVIAGKDAAIAILAALVARRQRTLSGQERHLHIALATSATAALVNVAQNVLVGGHEARRWGNAHANLVPYQLFEAADRPIVLAVGNDAQWRACAQVLGLPALADDPRFATNPARLAHREALVAQLAAVLRTRPASAWRDALTAAGVPSGLVRTVGEALAASGASPRTGVPPATGGTIRRPPPTLGQDADAIRRLGWDAFREP